MTERVEAIEKWKSGVKEKTPLHENKLSSSAFAAGEIVEQKKKAKNVIVRGLFEQDDEDEKGCFTKIINVLSSIGCSQEGVSIASTRRIGRKRDDGKPRPILVSMKDEENKALMRKKVNLRNSEKFKIVRINDDLTLGQRNYLSSLYQEAEAKNGGTFRHKTQIHRLWKT